MNDINLVHLKFTQQEVPRTGIFKSIVEHFANEQNFLVSDVFLFLKPS